jgi:hypothetical protein
LKREIPMGYIQESLSDGEEVRALFKLHWFAKIWMIIWIVLAIPTLGITLLLALWEWLITPAIIYDKPSIFVTPANPGSESGTGAGVQCDPGCRIESGMTMIDLFTRRSNRILYGIVCLLCMGLCYILRYIDKT